LSDLKRVLIVGGETHIGEITALAGRRLDIVGYAVRQDQIETVQREFGGAVSADYRALLDRTSPDIVAVANENDRKAEVCLEALRRGMHVIVDKPMALTVQEVHALRRAAQEAGRHVLMLLTLRGHPAYRKVREIVRSGEIGEPVQVYQKMSVELRWGKRPPWFFDRRRSGGPILDLAIHGVDQFEWVTGLRLMDVTAQESNRSRPEERYLTDSGAMFFRLENGGTAFIEHNRLLPEGQGSDYRLRVVGTRGQVDIRTKHYLWVQTAAGRRDLDLATLGPAVSVVEDWLDALASGAEPLVPDEASFRANEICCLAVRAAEQGITLRLP